MSYVLVEIDYQCTVSANGQRVSERQVPNASRCQASVNCLDATHNEYQKTSVKYL